MGRSRVEELADIIVNLAKRDEMGGTGRVIKDELYALGYEDKEISEAISEVSSKFRVETVGNVIKVYFSKRRKVFNV